MAMALSLLLVGCGDDFDITDPFPIGSAVIYGKVSGPDGSPVPGAQVSVSGWETECFNVAPQGSNSRPSSSGVRPVRTSSTICRRNSSGYGPRVLGMVASFQIQEVECPRKRENYSPSRW